MGNFALFGRLALAILQIVGVIGNYSERSAGRAEEQSTESALVTSRVADGDQIVTDVAGMSDAAVDAELRTTDP